MGQLLASPVTSTLIERSGSNYFQVGVASMQGWRLNHEDAHSHNPKWVGDRVGHFAVFDGHGGTPTAIYAAKHLQNDLSGLPQPYSDDDIKNCFISLDEKFFNSTKEHSSGSTCVSAIITRNEDGSYTLKVANLGDSRAILWQKNGELRSTVDHKPDHPEERQRIESAGGYVSSLIPARLDGSLSLSRAFGDFQYKRNPKLAPNKQKASVEPEVYTWQASKEDILVLACDGIFDVYENNNLKNEITQRLETTSDLGQIAFEIVQKALERGSQDNMTLMIIALRDGTDSVSPNELTLGNFLNEQDSRVRENYLNFASSHGFQSFPNACVACGKLFSEMIKCECEKVFYCSSACQEKNVCQHETNSTRESN